MIVIGITGGSGAGKTTALNVLEGLGAKIVDCDELYHDLLETSAEMLGEIGQSFPQAFQGGKFDRKKLGSIVFSDRQAMERLNSITHKYVGEQVDKILQGHRASGGKIAAVDAIALLESGISGVCDAVVGIVAPREVRMRRIMVREGISSQYAASRIDGQKSEEYFRGNCDYIIENNFPEKAEFINRCSELFKKIIEEKHNGRN